MLIKLVDSKQANEIILDFFIIFFPTHISATRSGVGVLFFMFLLVGTLLYVSPFSHCGCPAVGRSYTR